MNYKTQKTVRKRARMRLKRKGKRVANKTFKTRKPQRGQVMNGEPRRWLKNQLKG